MGVDGLLKAMGSIAERNVHVKRYRGKQVVIDGYTWLHKACYACSRDVVLSTFQRQKRNGRYPSFVEYCLHRLNLMRHFKLSPVVIFDGAKLVAKDSTEGKRDEKRKKASDAGKKLLDQAKRLPKGSPAAEKLIDEANSYFQQAISISPEVMAITLEALRKNNFEFIIAPYEADAQLAYEAKIRNGCDVIITEDSDVMVYCLAAGASSARILCKMDRNGIGVEFDLRKLKGNIMSNAKSHVSNKSGNGQRETKTTKKQKRKDVFAINLKQMTPTMFVQMAVLAGCDYCDSIKGIGIKKAQSLVVKFAKSSDESRISKIIDHIDKNDKKKFIPENYQKNVEKAIQTFMHHWVCDTRLGCVRMINLNPIPENLELKSMSSVIGEKYNADTLRRVVKGIMHPRTKVLYSHYLNEKKGKTPTRSWSAAHQSFSTSPTFSKRLPKQHISGIAYSFQHPRSFPKDQHLRTTATPSASTILIDSPSQDLGYSGGRSSCQANKQGIEIKNIVPGILESIVNITRKSTEGKDSAQLRPRNVSDMLTPGSKSSLTTMPKTANTVKCGDKAAKPVDKHIHTKQSRPPPKYSAYYVKTEKHAQSSIVRFYAKVNSNPMLQHPCKEGHFKVGAKRRKFEKLRKGNTKSAQALKRRKKKKGNSQGKKLTAFFARKETP